jgi:hypothetical protein
MAQHTFEEKNQVPGPSYKLYKLYVIFGIFLVIVPIMGLSYFTFFIHGLISSTVLGNESIEFKRNLVEINIHDITKNVEMLNNFVESHLLKSKEEERSKLMSIRSPAEHAKKKRAYSVIKEERLNEIQSRLKIIKKRRYQSMVDLRENGKNLVKNKYLIKESERYLKDLVWLSVFSLLVMCLGSLMAKTGFKGWNRAY